MKKFLLLIVLLFILNIISAQKTAAVTYSNSYTFIDSLGKRKMKSEICKDFYFADAHREVKLLKQLVEKKIAFDDYQKGNYQHHTMLFDYDSVASYSISTFKKENAALFRKNLSDSTKWQIVDSTTVILKYVTQIAVRTDETGRLHRVFFTNALSDYKIKLGNIEVPGFVLRYEIERKIFKGVGIEAITASNIDFYEEVIRFPQGYPIKKSYWK